MGGRATSDKAAAQSAALGTSSVISIHYYHPNEAYFSAF